MKLSRRGFLAAGAGVLAAPGLAGLVAGRGGVETGDREDCLWSAQAPSMPPAPRFEGDRKVDLAIVGGGYTGLACAYYAKLFRPDWTVIVLESHGLGSGASSRNSGAVYARHLGKIHPWTQLGIDERAAEFQTVSGVAASAPDAANNTAIEAGPTILEPPADIA